jgi:hypothetical protein
MKLFAAGNGACHLRQRPHQAGIAGFLICEIGSGKDAGAGNDVNLPGVI